MIVKFLFDRIVSLLLAVALLPLWVVVSLLIVLDSQGGPFFVQTRIGKKGKPFGLVKFRTMRPRSEGSGKLTIGSRDPRVTRAGLWLRKYKIDELPQLFNVLVGHMSLVGPRPEVPEFVALYDARQAGVLKVRPGITDYASLKYFDENAILADAEDPHKTYIRKIMPEKIDMNLQYIERRSFAEDLRILWLTLLRFFKR